MKEQLIDLRNYLKQNPSKLEKGLCGLLVLRALEHQMPQETATDVIVYILQHRPKWISWYSSFYNIFGEYYWKPGKVAPRLRWLNHLISKL